MNIRASSNINPVIIGSISFILGTAAGWIARGHFLTILFDSYLPALVTLLAAYYGAKKAFDFQRIKEIEDTKRKNVANGNLVIFNMTRMINNLNDFQKQQINPIRKNPSAFLDMPPNPTFSKADISVDINSIYYILETDPNLLGHISVAILTYQRVLDLIEERSITYIREVEPALEKEGMVHGSYPSERIKNALGDRLYVRMETSTKQIIELVDKAIPRLRDV